LAFLRLEKILSSKWSNGQGNGQGCPPRSHKPATSWSPVGHRLAIITLDAPISQAEKGLAEMAANKKAMCRYNN
jgi:hypothetical protein